MCSDLTLRTAFLNFTVEGNNVMIAYAVEATLAMPAVNVLGMEVPALGSCRAVDNDVLNVSHYLYLLSLILPPLPFLPVCRPGMGKYPSTIVE